MSPTTFAEIMARRASSPGPDLYAPVTFTDRQECLRWVSDHAPPPHLLREVIPPFVEARPLDSPDGLRRMLVRRLYLYGVAVVEWEAAPPLLEGAVSGVIIDGMVERQRRRRARALVTEAAHWPDGRLTPLRGEAE